jgi:hypothetical protein
VPSGGSGGPFTYEWLPANTITNPLDSATIATPIDTTDYIIRVFDPASGCTAFDTVHINVSAPYLSMNPSIAPNTYCPGGDSISLTSNAAAGNCESYRVRSIPHSPTPVNPVAGNVIVLGLGTVQGPYPLGFDLNFYCDTVTQFWVSSGGWISFVDPNNTPYTTTQQIPSAANPNSIIAFLWGNFIASPFGGNFLNYVVTGTAPNRIGLLTLTNGLSANNNSADNTVQLKIFEARDDIEVHITRANTGANSTIGIEGPLGQMGVAARNNAPFTISAGQEEAWRFSYDKGDPWVVNWYEQPLPGNLVGTGDLVKIAPTNPTSYCAVITDIASSCNDTICPPTVVSAASLSANGPTGPQLIGSTPSITTVYSGIQNPTCDGFQVPSIPFSPVNSGTGPVSLTMNDDDTQGPFNLGFNFDWYCNTVTQVWINSNGWLSFSDPGTNIPGPFNIPDPFAPDDMVSFVGSDLEPNVGGTINYQTVGTAPNRKFILNFINVPYYFSPSTVSVQVVIDEAEGFIEFHNDRIEADPFYNITQGVQRDNATGVAAPGRNSVVPSSAITADGVRFRPNTNIRCSWTSSAGPGLLQDSTDCNPTTVPLASANSLICFTDSLNNGTCILDATVCIQVGALSLSEFNLNSEVLNRQVKLTWDLEESNGWERFMVEHASQGGQFEPLGELQAGQQKNFSWLHEDPVEGLNRYRLRAFDAEGSYTYSNVVEAFIGELQEHLVSIYPNPGSGAFTLSYHLPEPAKVDLQVSDLQGKVLLTTSAIQETAGSFVERFDLADCAPGVYLYELRINGKTIGGKIQLRR